MSSILVALAMAELVGVFTLGLEASMPTAGRLCSRAALLPLGRVGGPSIFLTLDNSILNLSTGERGKRALNLEMVTRGGGSVA